MNFDLFFQALSATSLAQYAGELKKLAEQKIENPGQGDFEKWSRAFAELPEVVPSQIDLNRNAILIGQLSDLKLERRLPEILMKFHPWRKGPFELFGTLIDTEWRSDLKWERIQKSIQPLKDRLILDLGCGNGYYLWRMLGEGARLALGVDPSWLYFFQFQVMQKYIQSSKTMVLPLGVEELPANLNGVDTVFSMGLLYHRRDPLEHLKRLNDFLRPGGQVVLETLVIDGGKEDVLKPTERYAKMRNVWHVPSCLAAESWLQQAGFQNARCVDVSLTTLEEQRKTEWMTFESLDDFLNSSDITKTIEDYPAPKRAVFIAEKP